MEDVVDGAKIGVHGPPRQQNFFLEAPARIGCARDVGQQQLYRNGFAVERAVARRVYLAHAAAGDQPLNLEPLGQCVAGAEPGLAQPGRRG